MPNHLHIKCAALLVVFIWLSACKHHQPTVSSAKKPVKKTAPLQHTEPETAKTETKAPEKSQSGGSSVLRATYAERLSVREEDIKNEKLYKFIDDWYAVPYKYAGKDKNGIDCSGFTGVLCSEVYNKKVSTSSRSIYEETKRISVSELKEGDLVFFIINGKSVSHVGVYLQHNKFVHASTRRGVIISDLDEPYYKKYYHGAGRIK
jgi:cell wall-associated NlpC family hydrolase